MRFAVVDVETSGLSTRRNRILQLGIVTVVDGLIVDEWESLVKLNRPWQGVGPRKVHGITRAELRDAPDLKSVMTAAASRIDGAVLVAHNLDFDRAFLTRSARKAGVQLRPQYELCTLDLSRSLDPDRQYSHRLADIAQRYGIVNDQPHDALHDARTTAQVLPHLLTAAGEDVAQLATNQSAYRAARR